MGGLLILLTSVTHLAFNVLERWEGRSLSFVIVTNTISFEHFRGGMSLDFITVSNTFSFNLLERWEGDVFELYSRH